jgi:predicted lipoprotein with Yx(FWY)xxD motif
VFVLGQMLTDGHARTLYKYARDGFDVSTCVDVCAQTWLPYAPPPGGLSAPPRVTGRLAILTRPDGSKQVSYNGAPLYYFVNDVQPGDVGGQGVDSAWSVVNP